VMSFVGAGRGDYITETNYRYVGAGQGNLTVNTPFMILWGRILCFLLTLLLLALLIYFLTRPGMSTTSTTTTRAAPLPIGECTFWGDPHLVSFDGGRPSFYGDGEYWIVRADAVRIQGRYMGTKYTEGLAATNKIVVGGAFLKGHTIMVGTLESDVLTVDGQPVLAGFPSSYTLPGGAGSLTYNDQGELVDPATKVWEKRVVTMSLPMGVHITVFRWANYLDLRIRMPALPGIDGSCGNFNNDPSDDTTEAIMARIGATVPHGENMFHSRADIDWTTTEEKLLALCPRDKYSTGQSRCQGGTMQVKSCMINFCFGSNEHALRMAKSLGI